MVEVRWLDSAKEDLRDIYDFIALDSKKYAGYQIRKIRQRTHILKSYPKAGKITEGFNDESVRELASGSYRIFYTIVSEELVHVLMIHHGARKFPRER